MIPTTSARLAEIQRTSAITSLWLASSIINHVKPRTARVEISTTRESGITHTGTALRHSDIFLAAFPPPKK